MIKEYIPVLFTERRILLFFFNIKAPREANMTCVSALNTIIMGVPDTKNPRLVKRATEIATDGEMNMAINTGTWLASVKEAGSKTNFGANIGIIIPIAQSNPAMVMVLILVSVFIDILPSFWCVHIENSSIDSCLVSCILYGKVRILSIGFNREKPIYKINFVNWNNLCK
jgi:hypothetical protein